MENSSQMTEVIQVLEQPSFPQLCNEKGPGGKHWHSIPLDDSSILWGWDSNSFCRMSVFSTFIGYLMDDALQLTINYINFYL